MTKREEKVQHMRRILLDGALSVLHECGVSGFTLEAVAQQAGVSKGGLLHHFANKEALVAALLEEMMAQFAASVAAQAAQQGHLPGSLLRAYIRASMNDTTALFPALGALLAVSVLESPELLALVQEDAATWQRQLTADAVAAGLPPARAHLVRQAADATWFDQLIGAGTTREENQALLHELLALCEGATA